MNCSYGRQTVGIPRSNLALPTSGELSYRTEPFRLPDLTHRFRLVVSSKSFLDRDS